MDYFRKRIFIVFIASLKLMYLTVEANDHDYKISTINESKKPLTLDLLVRNNDSLVVKWKTLAGYYFGHEIKLNDLNNTRVIQSKSFPSRIKTYTFNELTAGEIYFIQICTLFDDTTLINCTSDKFSTKPNPPLEINVKSRSETKLSVKWLPSYPQGKLNYYEASIISTNQTKIMSNTDNEVTFQDLFPGKAYNISVKSISNNITSNSIMVRGRTKPAMPSNVRVMTSSITTTSFRITWEPPKQKSEFDKYQVLLNKNPLNTLLDPDFRPVPVIKNQNSYEFIRLYPGQRYRCFVETVSEDISSHPASQSQIEVTTKPFPVENLQAYWKNDRKSIIISWDTNPSSYQEQYEVSLTDMTEGGGRTDVTYANQPRIILHEHFGNKYNITVLSISGAAASDPCNIIITK